MPSPDGNCVRRLFAPSIFLIPSTSYRDALNNTHLIIHGPTAMASGGNLAKFKVPQPLEAKSRQQKRGSPTAGSDGLLVFVFLRRPLAIRSRKTAPDDHHHGTGPREGVGRRRRVPEPMELGQEMVQATVPQASLGSCSSGLLLAFQSRTLTFLCSGCFATLYL